MVRSGIRLGKHNADLNRRRLLFKEIQDREIDFGALEPGQARLPLFPGHRQADDGDRLGGHPGQAQSPLDIDVTAPFQELPCSAQIDPAQRRLHLRACQRPAIHEKLQERGCLAR